MRCVNIDWLELYCLESNDEYPCNADYFRRHGYFVKERDYGTRVYKEMFVIEDDEGNPLIEIRRNPMSGQSDFRGLLPQSTHIRLPNWMCYRDDCIDFIRNFMIRHNYIFKRIYRIDICLDFEYFDSGDRPDRFAKRYLERVYRKYNQCKMSAYGNDAWNDFEWETISWGNPTSMVSTKMYNKTKELNSVRHDKPYIRTAWFLCGLVDNPVECTKVGKDGQLYKPDIWRVEFSMKSKADRWLIIEDGDKGKAVKRAIPHRLDMFDSKDKLWQRFQDLAHHYFRFKYREYKDEGHALANITFNKGKVFDSKELKRKDRCQDKVLFKWDRDHVFCQLSQLPKPSKPDNFDLRLKAALMKFQSITFDPKLRNAAEAILKKIEQNEARRVTPHQTLRETEALQRVIALKLGGDTREAIEILEEVRQLLCDDLIF